MYSHTLTRPSLSHVGPHRPGARSRLAAVDNKPAVAYRAHLLYVSARGQAKIEAAAAGKYVAVLFCPNAEWPCCYTRRHISGCCYRAKLCYRSCRQKLWRAGPIDIFSREALRSKGEVGPEKSSLLLHRRPEQSIFGSIAWERRRARHRLSTALLKRLPRPASEAILPTVSALPYAVTRPAEHCRILNSERGTVQRGMPAGPPIVFLNIRR